MIEEMSRKVLAFQKKYGVPTISEKSLRDALLEQGYTVIYFNKAANKENVSQVIENLGLEDLVLCHNGFTYADTKYRLVFVNEELTAEERIMVLAHEEGHIFCDHVSRQSILGEDVKQEHEANEFAHYLLHPNPHKIIRRWISAHKKLVITLAACLLLVVGGITCAAVIAKKQFYIMEYYVTESGTKYHQKDCIFIKDKKNVRRFTQEEADSGEYSPCKVCLP